MFVCYIHGVNCKWVGCQSSDLKVYPNAPHVLCKEMILLLKCYFAETNHNPINLADPVGRTSQLILAEPLISLTLGLHFKGILSDMPVFMLRFSCVVMTAC